MTKVLVKHKFDMNDADYIYGIKVLDKEEYDAYVNWVNKQDSINVYHNNDETERGPKEILAEQRVTELTDSEYLTLQKLGLLEHGQELAGWWQMEEDQDEEADMFDDEDEEE